jgi:hypothetical protein
MDEFFAEFMATPLWFQAIIIGGLILDVFLFGLLGIVMTEK